MMSRKNFDEIGYRQKRRRILDEINKQNRNIENPIATTSNNLTNNNSNIETEYSVIYQESFEQTHDVVVNETQKNSSAQSTYKICDSFDFQTLNKNLQEWVINFNISHAAVNKLLSILKRVDSLKDLPCDVRTLMKTPRNSSSNILNINGGEFVHFGLERGIKRSLKKHYEELPKKIKINVNVDGLPLTKSTSSQFWPILGCFVDKLKAKPFIISIHHGNEKPLSSNIFLKNFIEESEDLLQNGITVDDTFVEFEINAIICDAPAKAFISGIKGHTGYFGCSKCIQEGEFVNNRMTFPQSDSELRTDESFKSRKHEEHHKYTSDLENTIGMVSQQPLDYMHLVCIGITKRLIKFFVHGRKDMRLKQDELNKISDHLVSLKSCICREFARKPRSLFEIDRWKATELRQFLLYTGPVILKSVLSQDQFDHFIVLSCGIRILCDESTHLILNDYAKSLLTWFAEQYSKLYGNEYVTYNVHNVIHLADDVKKFGPLDKFSAFVFENYMQNIKKKLKVSSKPLHQLFNRIEEENQQFQEPVKILTEPIIKENCVIFNDFSLTSKCFENNFQCSIGNYFEIDKIEFENNSYTIKARKYLKYEPFFAYPLDSTKLGIVQVKSSDLDENIVQINLKSIRRKVTKICSYEKDTFVLFPLIHTENQI